MELYYPIIQEEMQTATYRPCMSNLYYPFRRYDEVFRRVSDSIPYIEDHYWVSCFGRVYNEKLHHLVTNTIDHGGYQLVALRKKPPFVTNPTNPFVHIGIHTLVCSAFHGPKPTPIHQVNHINFIRHYNEWENLEWLTPKENNNYSLDFNKNNPRYRHKDSNKE